MEGMLILVICLLTSRPNVVGFDLSDFVKETYNHFGPGSEYDNPIVDNYTWKAGEYTCWFDG